MEVADTDCDVECTTVSEDLMIVDFKTFHGSWVAQISVIDYPFLDGASDEIASVSELSSHFYLAYWECRSLIGHFRGVLYGFPESDQLRSVEIEVSPQNSSKSCLALYLQRHAPRLPPNGKSMGLRKRGLQPR